MRTEIKELEKMGPLPPNEIAMLPEQRQNMERYGMLIASIRKPVTDEEARVLISLLGPDDCFEMAETLVRFIETAPGWPLWDCLEDTSNGWISTLRQRLENAGIRGPGKEG
jgi:hypothetical protein